MALEKETVSKPLIYYLGEHYSYIICGELEWRCLKACNTKSCMSLETVYFLQRIFHLGNKIKDENLNFYLFDVANIVFMPFLYVCDVVQI